MNRMPSIAALCCLLAVSVASLAAQAKDDPVYKPGAGVTAPVVTHEVKPQYTREAMEAKVQGTVVLECVVEKDGKVGEVKVTRSLEPGLDEQAVLALKQWRFEPGKKDGKAVRVRVSLEMTFSLR